jgi:hypothetical protein
MLKKERKNEKKKYLINSKPETLLMFLKRMTKRKLLEPKKSSLKKSLI